MAMAGGTVIRRRLAATMGTVSAMPSRRRLALLTGSWSSAWPSDHTPDFVVQPKQGEHVCSLCAMRAYPGFSASGGWATLFSRTVTFPSLSFTTRNWSKTLPLSES